LPEGKKAYVVTLPLKVGREGMRKKEKKGNHAKKRDYFISLLIRGFKFILGA